MDGESSKSLRKPVKTGDDVKRKGEPGERLDTFGQPAVSHVVLIEQRYDSYMKTIESIKEYLVAKNLPAQSDNWKKKHFAYLCIKPYCKKSGQELLPAEFSIVIFSFDDGIVEMHGGFIDPGEIPLGEKGEVQITCDINGYPFPGENQEEVRKLMPVITPKKFMDTIFQLSKKYGLLMGTDLLYFACRKDVTITNCCLKWITAQTETEKPKFHIVSFEVLLMQMSQLVDNAAETVGVIHYEGGAAKFICSTRYDYDSSLACEWHRHGPAAEKLDCCTQNIALRRVYNAIFYLCHLFERDIPAQTHKPVEKYNVKKLCKDMKSL